MFRAAGNDDPRIALTALNLHGGEGGQLGSEEGDEIGPAVEWAKSAGIGASRPVTADIVFMLGRATTTSFQCSPL